MVLVPVLLRSDSNKERSFAAAFHLDWNHVPNNSLYVYFIVSGITGITRRAIVDGLVPYNVPRATI
jgi:hypothetical protein